MSTLELQFSGVPTAVAHTIRKVYDATGGIDLEGAVLAEAQSDTSPLHGYFEWDDTEAAANYRRIQAAHLIRRCKVGVLQSPDSPAVKVRAYVARREIAQRTEDISPGSYLAIDEIAGRTAYEVSLRDAMRRDILRLQKRYDNTSLLLEVAQEVWG